MTRAAVCRIAPPLLGSGPDGRHPRRRHRGLAEGDSPVVGRERQRDQHPQAGALELHRDGFEEPPVLEHATAEHDGVQPARFRHGHAGSDRHVGHARVEAGRDRWYGDARVEVATAARIGAPGID